MSVALETAPPRQTDRRQEILSVARELMLAEGFDKTSMRNIAARMGVTPTTLYLYFRNKEDIIFHLMEESLQILWDRLGEVMAREGDPLARLRRALEIYARYGLDNPDHYRIVFMRMRGEIGEGDNTDSISERAQRLLTELVSDCIDAGRLQALPVRAVGEVLWASVHGLVALILRGRKIESQPDELLKVQLDALLKGFEFSKSGL